MADALLNALHRKLVAYEAAGMTDHAKAVKVRITKLEKPKSKAKKSTEEPADSGEEN